MRGQQQIFASMHRTAAGDFAVNTSYDRGFVSALKAQIPPSERAWEPISKVWLVDPRSAGVAAALIRQFFGVDIPISTAHTPNPQVETKLIKLEYLGAAKDRGGAEPTASGWVDGAWSAVFPLSVLEAWFIGIEPSGNGGKPGGQRKAGTLYAVLGVKTTATEPEIKKAYRRLARQWHPDVCSEPDAAEQFMRITDAYKILTDDRQRARYDLGLQMAASLETQALPDYSMIADSVWRPPLRCGWLLVEGTTRLGRLQVTKILQWEDIVNDQGQVMVSSWPKWGDHFEICWA